MRHLVVGGAGYIGSVVARHLLDAGHDVTVADNLSKGHERAVPDGAVLRRVDVLDLPALTAVLAEGFDAVLHFAALSLVGESVTEPVRYFRTNLGGTLNLLDAMRDAQVRRLVFSSTAAVYGEPETVPITETASTRPTNPYPTEPPSWPATRRSATRRPPRDWRPSASGTSTSPVPPVARARTIPRRPT